RGSRRSRIAATARCRRTYAKRCSTGFATSFAAPDGVRRPRNSIRGSKTPACRRSTPRSAARRSNATIARPTGYERRTANWWARDPRLDRPVALKLLRHLEKDCDARESAIIEEGRLLARIRHPNVVAVHGAERIDGRIGIWMEFVDGPTLEQELVNRGPFSPE